MPPLITNRRQFGSITIVDLRGSIDLGEASLTPSPHYSRFGRKRPNQNHPQFLPSEFHGQCRNWRTGWRLRASEVQGRRAEDIESDEKGSRHAADHSAGQSLRGLYGRTNGNSELFLNGPNAKSDICVSFGFPPATCPRRHREGLFAPGLISKPGLLLIVQRR
jgi:hypothetical protein